MLSILEIVRKTTEYFASKGIDSPRLNAETLVSHALGLKRMQLYVQFERLLTEPELAAIRPLVKRRSAREPLQYIIGEVDWSGLRLKVDRRALIPRPETEYLFELVCERVEATPPSAIADLGTGTGALALAAAKTWADATVTAVDCSAEALALAKENAATLGLSERVTFLQSDWFAAVRSELTFDLVLANPPYLTDVELNEAEPEVREHEPRSALVADQEGRADLLAILDQSIPRTRPGGWLALETGIAQHAVLAEKARSLGWSNVESVRDLTGRDRFLFARRPAD